MKKILLTLYALIILLKNKCSSAVKVAEPRFCGKNTNASGELEGEQRCRPGCLKNKIMQPLTSVAIIALLAFPSQASWVDDYFATAVTTNASSYESQKRNYYTGGGFTARVPYKSEPVLTISTPTISTGCGGIDTFWGGISFLNADYLVKKAEGILKNAPYVIFSLGLQALSTSFADTLNNVQAITDQLNQLSLDECTAAKGVVNFAMTGEAPGIINEFNNLKTNVSSLKDGIAKDWKKLKNKTDDNPGTAKKENVDRKITDPKIKELLTGKGSVLEQLTRWGNINKNEADAIRAIVGDVFYDNTKAKSTGEITVSSGCGYELDFRNYIVEKTPYQEVNGNKLICARAADSIQERSDKYMTILKNALTDDSLRKVALNNDMVDFINRTDIPVLAYLSTASIAGTVYVDAAAQILATTTASGYAYGSLKNLSGNINKVIYSLKNDLSKEDLYTIDMVTKLEEYYNQIDKRMDGFQKEYLSELDRLDVIFELAKKTENMARDIQAINKNSYLSAKTKE